VVDQPKNKNAPKKKARDEFNEEEIFQAPVITRDPQSRQAKLGSKVVLRVQATGRPLPSYQWFHNGKKIVGATSDRLTLSKVRRMAAGGYHCEVKNFVGKATSRVCMLSFFTQKVPKITIGTDVKKVEEGKPFTLKVTSPPLAELKDFSICWIFNGMRIKGAVGPELRISAMKKKYEGEYKALIAAGGMLESSNVAKLTMTPSRDPAAPVPESPSKSLDDVLAQEPTVPLRTGKVVAPAPGPSWDELSFNPEAENTEASLIAPAPEAEPFANMAAHALAAQAPLTQLPTQDLIREVAAAGGASELLEKVEREDPSGLIVAAENAAVADFPSEDPSSLILGAEAFGGDPPIPAEDPSGLILAAEAAPVTAPPVPAEDPSALISAAENPPALVAVPAPEPANPRLEQKKAMLQKLLGSWQGRARKAA
jgi:hypothetical protein